ncbi:T9SS type B sorting domain-containing protein [Pedobacter sp. HMF7647]|uniref:T9SS type B sorting domain-containing protein n=1 Tax=Hufsiella arboris TaxID=2695275 RepID=A0A7K1YFX0_9SPHI|nr:gliding motility-associated C-terminal domain-containing protein [Hufsiella arboris]MXV52879.1 T9SS type B sorting domain-containing protein [Hufsiella arboris]
MNLNLKPLYLLAAFFLFFCSAHADTFVVTSNADSGPGTLREALTLAAANGSAVKDYINFNLPGSTEADRTIVLLSELDNISSNLVIDGSTQPGVALGITDARIELKAAPNFISSAISNVVTGIRIYNVNDIELYSLYFRGFNQSNMGSRGTNIIAGLYVQSVTNLFLGNSGHKGNVFGDNDYSVIGGARNVVVKSNLLGFDILGQVVPSKANSTFTFSDLNFGGDLPEDQNILSKWIGISGDNVIIKNINKIPPFTLPLTFMNLNYDPRIYINGGSNITFKDNTLNFIYLGYTTNFNVVGNKLSNNGFISVFNSNYGIIGGSSVNEENIINYGPGILNTNSKNIQVLHNSIICTTNAYQITNNISTPEIKVLIHSTTEFSGTATPGSIVNIYEDNSNCSICNPVAFYQQVIADASGNWKITGSFATKRFVANATFNNNSSEFTQPRIDNDPVYQVISQPTCGLNNGSIRLDNLHNVLLVEWYNNNSQNTVIATGEELQNVGPGTYFAKLHNGACQIRSPSYTLTNVTPAISANSLTVTQPSCSLSSGSINGLTASNFQADIVTYSWKDQDGNVVGNTANLTQVGAGQYTLYASAKGCTVPYGPVVLQNIPGPEIDVSNVRILPGLCGNATGSITGVSTRGTGTLAYQWKHEDGTNIAGATNTDLTNALAGKYILQVSDQSICSPKLSSPIEVPELGTITITESAAQLRQAQCDGALGSITGFAVSGADRYEWISANGQSIITSSADLVHAAPGKYHLKASNAYCEAFSGEYEIYAPIAIDQSAVTIKDDECGNSVGLISGINVTGGKPPFTFKWTDASGALLNRPNSPNVNSLSAGTYTLTVSDAGGSCPVNATFAVSNYRPGIDLSSMLVQTARCGKNGSIRSIRATGKGAITYTWKREDGTIVSTNTVAELLNASPGKYILEVKDQSSCPPLQSAAIEIPDLGSIAISSSNVQLQHPDCNHPSGAINGLAITGATKYEWIDQNGTSIITPTPNLYNVNPGKYYLKASNQYCDAVSDVYEILEPLELVVRHLKKQDDECGHSSGSIKGLEVTGGQPPYSFTWLDADQQLISTSASSADISGLKEGAYNLMITDSRRACQLGIQFQVKNSQSVVPAPSANDTQICSAGTAVIAVNAPTAGSYRLYDAKESGKLLDENTTGTFLVDVKSSTKFYLRAVDGSCESATVQVNVSVSSDVKIPNTITPNGDGINDTWMIAHIENYPGINVKVFNRYGSVVFSSTGYKTPFDGSRNGQPLSAGVYYYIIDLKKDCKSLTGSLTVLR